MIRHRVRLVVVLLNHRESLLVAGSEMCDGALEHLIILPSQYLPLVLPLREHLFV